MLLYLTRKLVHAVFTLSLLSMILFGLLRFAPGHFYDSEIAWPAALQAQRNQFYAMDKPLPLQFAHWVRDLAHGDLGESFQYPGHAVTEIIAQSLPLSFFLGSWALLISLVIGLPIGLMNACHTQKSWISKALMFFAVSGLSVPSYLTASLLILIFSLKLRWLPPALWEGPSSAILPILTLSWRPLGLFARIAQASMTQTLTEDYIRTAVGKGLAPIKIVFKHALKNSLIPIMSVFGSISASFLAGSFLVEVTFQIPGMGHYFVQSILNRDYPLVMGTVGVFGILLIFSNLITDLLLALVDPRIRLSLE